jgi:hypothetical protein
MNSEKMTFPVGTVLKMEEYIGPAPKGWKDCDGAMTEFKAQGKIFSMLAPDMRKEADRWIIKISDELD